MSLSDLMFELSNEDRLRILHILRNEPMNITNLSKSLDLTVQEVSRHVSRLNEVGLISRHVDGLQYVTTYAKLVLKQLNTLTFMSANRTYFNSHVMNIPSEFLSQIEVNKKLSGKIYDKFPVFDGVIHDSSLGIRRVL